MTSNSLANLEAFPGEPVTAFFSTRTGGVSPPPYHSLNLGRHTGDNPENVDANWERLLRSNNLEQQILCMPRLVHGATLIAADPPRDISCEAADALYTCSPDQVLAVTTADCLPILLFDPERGLIAAVHAGWRGTREGILEKALRTLLRENRISAATTRLAFGPCLQAENLEIGSDIAATLPKQHVRLKRGRFTFDMPGANFEQALSAGIKARHIHIFSECTWNDPDRFFSHRRDKGITGRMAAVIAL